MRRGGLDGPTSKLEAIFSPRRRGRRSCGEVLLENMTASPPPKNVSTSSSPKSSGSGRLRQTQPQNEVNNFRLRSHTHQNSVSTPKKSEFRKRIPSHTGNKREDFKEARGNSIKDRIKFFDGCVERSTPYGLHPSATNSAHGPRFSVSTAPKSNAQFSLVQNIVPTTPTHHTPTGPHVAEPPSTSSTTGGSRYNTVSTKVCTPQTPTRSSLTNNTETRRPRAFEQPVPNPFLQKSHTKPPTRQISPMTTSTGQRMDKRNQLGCPIYVDSKVQDSTPRKASPEGNKCRSRIQEALANPVGPVSKERRSNQKVQALHDGQAVGRTGDATMDRRDSSKDKELKMLRERSVVAKSFELGPWSLSKASGTKIPRPTCRDSSGASSASPAHAPRSMTMKTVGECWKGLQMDGTRIPSLVRQDQGCPSSTRKAMCNGIHEKIKRWESTNEPKDRLEEHRQEDCSSNPADNSITFGKSTYENPWSEKVGRELEKGGLNGQEVQAVMDEFQDIGGHPKHSEETGGAWKIVLASRLGKAARADQMDGETDESSGDVDMRIIVREAQCGLAEPKPLRLLEMKRMILLCRDRVAEPGCKGQSSRAYPMKV
jgi:hypothetical protein